MAYLFYVTVGAVIGFFIFGPIGAFLVGFLGLLYGTRELQRKKKDDFLTEKIEQLEKEIEELKQRSN